LSPKTNLSILAV